MGFLYKIFKKKLTKKKIFEFIFFFPPIQGTPDFSKMNFPRYIFILTDNKKSKATLKQIGKFYFFESKPPFVKKQKHYTIPVQS